MRRVFLLKSLKLSHKISESFYLLCSFLKLNCVAGGVLEDCVFIRLAFSHKQVRSPEEQVVMLLCNKMSGLAVTVTRVIGNHSNKGYWLPWLPWL